ncbi:EAL domain-containing protein [Aliikangiella sp. IMCC44359]|uniref:EAL domain-containing protein n=1 Tax=Aliikangiella sp. IMCC44359 TaxID=3459125 RepID=UPI00403A9642
MVKGEYIGAISVIVVLLENTEKYQILFQQLEKHQLKIRVFRSVIELQRWLELNPAPMGIVVDFASSVFQDFLIRFSLRYPELPILSLKKQSEEQLLLRLRTFITRILKSTQNKTFGYILLVDDSKTVQLQYRKHLERDGFVVDVASNALEGYEKALKNKYDLAIIDYFMPGDNGAQLCKTLKDSEQTHELQCAILTAQYKQSVVDECLNAGARECMFKNESAGLFLTRVRALIRGVEGKRQVDSERARLIGLLYSVVEGVFGVTPDGRIQFVNPGALSFLGQSVVDLIGYFPHECIHPTDNRGQLTSFEHCFLQQAYMLGDELRDWRTLFRRSDGSLFPVECSVTRLGDKDDNQGAVVVFRDISEQERLEKNWQWRLNHDHLTGLFNRNAFEEVLGRELNRIRRTNDTALLLFIDLDKFKLINDELGHAAGDQLLVGLAENLSTRSRDTDYVGRLAGDEFVILLTEVIANEYHGLAEKYRTLLEEFSLFWKDEVYSVTGSIGLTEVNAQAESIGELLAQADQACQLAKRKGRNQWNFFDKDQTEVTEQGNWFKRLSNAMKLQKFTLLHQPIFKADDIKCQVGTNCLLRLNENNTLISPAIFMSDAKRFGVIKEIDCLVVEKLIEHCKNNAAMEGGWHSLCLSVDAISDQNFRNKIFELWYNSGLTPQHLRFEIGEEDLFKFSQWKKHLSKLRSYGFGIVISHFGMNTQSVLNLPQMPIDAIKLDTSLTRELATSIPRRNLIDAIVKTANQHNIEVIATHIESATELDLLQARGINQVQGFYLGKPESM